MSREKEHEHKRFPYWYLNEQKARTVIREGRGAQSVQNVVNSLSQRTDITKIILTEPNSQLDMEGKDIILQVEEISEDISIQVKSSKRKINEFRRLVARREGLPISQVNNWLIEHRLIILNGSIPEESITIRFQEQFNLIKQKFLNLG